MAIRDFFFKKQETQPTSVEVQPMISTFSTPFGKITEGNLSLPYVRSYSGSEPWIRFGSDNLYPQIINQLYYLSSLSSGIINYKCNAIIGGGYSLVSSDKSAKSKVEEYTFLKFNKFDKLCRLLTKDLVMHGRIYVKMCLLSNGKVKYTRISPEKVRVNADKTLFTISDDWARSVNIHTLPAYCPDFKGECVFAYEQDTPGQDIYPIPSYLSSANYQYLEGEIAYLQKSNIINSIYPSFMITMANKFRSDAEAQAFKDVINKAKGAPEAGRILTFIAEFDNNLPSITPIPQNSNDKIFDSTLLTIESSICKSHSIDALLMGIRVGGSLGQGNELKQSYVIFEKNVIMPLREEMEEILNDLLFIGGVQSTLTINEYQIIDTQITQTNPIY